MEETFALVIFITLILALKIYATKTEESKGKFKRVKNNSQINSEAPDSFTQDDLKELFSQDDMLKKRDRVGGHSCQEFYNCKRIRSAENPKINEPCIDNIMRSEDGKSYFGSFLEIPTSQLTNETNQQFKQLNQYRKVNGEKIRSLGRLLDILHWQGHAFSAVIIQGVPSLSPPAFRVGVIKLSHSGESHANHSTGNNEYSHHDSGDGKSVKEFAAADRCDEVKEERITFMQKSATERRKSKHRGNKQQLREYAGTNRSEKRQLAGGDHSTERTIAKRNIVLSALDPSQKTVLEEEMDQAKDKAALEHANIAQDIVTTVIKHSGANLRKTLGICQKYLPQNFIDANSEVHEHKLVQEVLSSVEEALISAVSCKDCVSLHKDLFGFLNWLVSGSSSHSCCIPVDKVHHNKNYFLFDPHHHMYGEQCNRSIGAINNAKLLNEAAMAATTCKGPTKPSPLSFASVTHAPEETDEMHNNPLRKEDQNRAGSPRKRVQNTVSLGGE